PTQAKCKRSAVCSAFTANAGPEELPLSLRNGFSFWMIFATVDIHRSMGPLPILPTLLHDTREEPQPELAIEARNRIAGDRPGDGVLERSGGAAEHVARHAGDVRHGGEVEPRLLRLLHVETGLGVEHRAADAAPVEPPAEVALGEPVGRNQVLDDDI